MRKFSKSAAFPILIVILLAFFVQNLFYGNQARKDLSFMGFQQLVQQQKVEDVRIKTKDLVVEGKIKDTGEVFSVGFTEGFAMEEFLLANKVDFRTDVQKQSIWLTLLGTFAPIILMVVFFLFIMNQMQGGGSKVMSFGKSRAKRLSLDAPKVTFADVAGVDEAIEELEEIKDFLENPKKFQSLGARIPKGCCSSALPEPARRCWHARWPAKRVFRSSASPVLTSWKCLWVSVPVACATCSPRPSRTSRALSS